MLLLHLGHHRVQQCVNDSQDGATQEESQVAANLADETGPVAHHVLRLIGEQEVLEPEVQYPIRPLVHAPQVVPVIHDSVGKFWPVSYTNN